MPVFFKPAFQITTAKTLRDSVTVLHDNLWHLGGLVAQLVEQCPFKALVQGSSPCQPTSLRPQRSEDEGCLAEARNPPKANVIPPQRPTARKAKVKSEGGLHHATRKRSEPRPGKPVWTP